MNDKKPLDIFYMNKEGTVVQDMNPEKNKFVQWILEQEATKEVNGKPKFFNIADFKASLKKNSNEDK